MLSLSANIQSKGRFHFESFWPKMEGFHDVVMEAWNSVTGIACPIRRLAFKLRATSRALQSWGQRKVGNVNQQLQQAKELLHRLDMV